MRIRIRKHILVEGWQSGAKLGKEGEGVLLMYHKAQNKVFDVLTCGEELFELFLLLVVGWDVAVVVLPPLLQVP
jgi:hypothetical protein